MPYLVYASSDIFLFFVLSPVFYVVYCHFVCVERHFRLHLLFCVIVVWLLLSEREDECGDEDVGCEDDDIHNEADACEV